MVDPSFDIQSYVLHTYVKELKPSHVRLEMTMRARENDPLHQLEASRCYDKRLDDYHEFYRDYRDAIEQNRPDPEDFEVQQLRIWAKVYRTQSIQYFYVPHIRLEERVKKWSINTDTFLKRLQVLLSKNKLIKEEVLMVVKKFRQTHEWTKHHATQFGTILKVLKTQTKKGGRFVLRFIGEKFATGDSKNLFKFPMRIKEETFKSLSKLRHKYDHGMLRPNVGMIERIYNQRYFCDSVLTIDERPFYIGPIRYWRKFTENGRQYSADVSVTEQFPYSINAHGESI